MDADRNNKNGICKLCKKHLEPIYKKGNKSLIEKVGYFCVDCKVFQPLADEKIVNVPPVPNSNLEHTGILTPPSVAKEIQEATLLTSGEKKEEKQEELPDEVEVLRFDFFSPCQELVFSMIQEAMKNGGSVFLPRLLSRVDQQHLFSLHEIEESLSFLISQGYVSHDSGWLNINR